MCTRGNPTLATGGSGDVLAGIIAALCCHAPPVDAACAGAFVHALVADRWRDRTQADRGMIAGDIIDGIPNAIASLPETTPDGMCRTSNLLSRDGTRGCRSS